MTNQIRHLKGDFPLFRAEGQEIPSLDRATGSILQRYSLHRRVPSIAGIREQENTHVERRYLRLGLLNLALDPEIPARGNPKFFGAEIDLLREMVAPGKRVLDVGCGTGRHLLLLGERLAVGIGVDYERSYVVDAARQVGPLPLSFVVGDATRIPLEGPFDLALCLTNTWGTMSDKAGVSGKCADWLQEPAPGFYRSTLRLPYRPGGSGIGGWAYRDGGDGGVSRR